MSEPPLILVAEPAAEDSSSGFPREPGGPKEAPQGDIGSIGLVIPARFHNIAVDPDQLTHDFRASGNNLTVPQTLLTANGQQQIR